MALSTDRNAFLLIRRYLAPKGSIAPVLDLPPQKPACPPPAPVALPFPRATPESQGVPSGAVAGFLAALRDDPGLDPHSVLVLRHGRVIAEASFGAYDLGIRHVTHSAAKSVTALAVGMLEGEGRLSLDAKVVDLFPEKATPLAKLLHRDLAVRHLLTMTSGVAFNELGSVTETDWVGRFLDSAQLTAPGATFFYNSMNTYLLSAIVRQVTGECLTDYLRPRLWEPLGIEGIHWERCPAGAEKGGWGLYIRLEDLAKVGQLVLQDGVWEGRRLVPEAFVRAATSKQAEVPAGTGDFDYGYQMWVGRGRRAFLFNGLFGQNVAGFPDLGLLVASNAGNPELFQTSPHFAHLATWLLDRPLADAPLPPDPTSVASLRALSAALRTGAPRGASDFPWATVLGRRFRIPEADAAEAGTVGVLPFFLQAMQNRYAKGLRGVSFEDSPDGPVLVVEEADVVHRLPVGYRSARTAALDFGGESYRVAVAGWRENRGGGSPVLLVRVSFLESSNARLIRCSFRKGGLLVRWTELPGTDFLSGALAMIRERVQKSRLVPLIENAEPLLKRAEPLIGRVRDAGSAYLGARVKRLLEPETWLAEGEGDAP